MSPTEMKNAFGCCPRIGTGWTPYVWLIYFPTLFFQPTMESAPRSVWILTWVAGAHFSPAVFRAHWARGREAYVIIASIVTLGALLVPINASGFVLFIYASGFAGTHMRTRHAVQTFVALTVIILAEALALHLPVYMWGWAAVLILDDRRRQRALCNCEERQCRSQAGSRRDRASRDRRRTRANCARSSRPPWPHAVDNVEIFTCVAARRSGIQRAQLPRFAM